MTGKSQRPSYLIQPDFVHSSLPFSADATKTKKKKKKKKRRKKVKKAAKGFAVHDDDVGGWKKSGQAEEDVEDKWADWERDNLGRLTNKTHPVYAQINTPAWPFSSFFGMRFAFSENVSRGERECVCGK